MENEFIKEFIRVSNSFVTEKSYNEHNFIIADFGSGSICLSDQVGLSDTEAIAIAWSVGAVGFLRVCENSVTFLSYLRRNPEKISMDKLAGSLGGYFKYLVDNYQVGPHAIDNSFRNFRLPIDISLESIKRDVNRFCSRDYHVAYHVIRPLTELAVPYLTEKCYPLAINMQFEKGQYEFPFYMAKLMSGMLHYDSLLKKNEISILDPSCGMGTLLMGAIDTLVKRGYDGRLNILGWDVDPSMKAACLYRLTNKYNSDKISIRIEVKDSVKEPWDGLYDIILLDPPVIDSELLEEWVDYKLTKPNLLNVAALFVSKASYCLSDKGEMLAALPMALFKRNNFIQWRQMLSERVCPRAIVSLGNGLFSRTHDPMAIFVGGLTESSLVSMVWTGANSVEVRDVRFCLEKLTEQRSFVYSGVCEGYSMRPCELSPDTWEPVSLKTRQIMKSLSYGRDTGRLIKLGTLFHIIRCKTLPSSVIDAAMIKCVGGSTNEHSKSIFVDANNIGNSDYFPLINTNRIGEEHLLSKSKRAILISKKIAYKRAFMPLYRNVACVSDGYLWEPYGVLKYGDLSMCYLALFMSTAFEELVSLQVPEQCNYGLMNLTATNLRNVLVPSPDLVLKNLQILMKEGELLMSGKKGNPIIDQIVRDMYGIL